MMRHDAPSVPCTQHVDGDQCAGTVSHCLPCWCSTYLYTVAGHHLATPGFLHAQQSMWLFQIYKKFGHTYTITFHAGLRIRKYGAVVRPRSFGGARCHCMMCIHDWLSCLWQLDKLQLCFCRRFAERVHLAARTADSSYMPEALSDGCAFYPDVYSVYKGQLDMLA